MLLLDVGNTLIKWRLLRDRELIAAGARPQLEMPELFDEMAANVVPEKVWVSSVAGEQFEDRLETEIGKKWAINPWFCRTSATMLGLKNGYDEPGRMGVDRWLAMLAAWAEIRGAVCVVDAGSALTIDFVNSSGQHLGGYIMPGIDSMESALLKDTDRVRFDHAARDQIQPGISTESAVYNGLLLSQAGAVSLALEKYGHGFDVMYTGGNGLVLNQVLADSGTHKDNLVLDGLLLAGNDQ